MATKAGPKIRAYSIGQPSVRVFPEPIVAQSAPGTNDFAEIGQVWIDVPNDAAYMLTSITGGDAQWQTSPASGVGTFTAVTVNPGDITATAGDVIITAGDLTVTAGDATIGGDLTVTGAANLNGDIDINTTALFDITSTLDANQAILFDATNGGIDITAQGTDAGDDLDLTSARLINLTSTFAGDGIVLNSSDAGGGITADAGSAGIRIGLSGDCAVLDLGNVVPTSARTTTIAQGTVASAIADTVNIAGGGVNDAGGSKVLNLNAGALVAGTHTTNIMSGAVTPGATHTLNISTGTGTKSVNIGNADAGTTITALGAVDINAANTGATTIGNVAGGVVSIVGGTNAAGALALLTNAGVNETITIINTQGTGTDAIDAQATAGGISLDAGLSAVNAMQLTASGADGQIVMHAGTNGILIGNQADCAVIDLGDVTPSAARTITVAGGQNTGAFADTVDILPDGMNNAGGSQVLNLMSGNLTAGTQTVNVGSGNRTAGTHVVNISTGTDTKTVNMGNADANTTINIDGVLAINNDVNAAVTINDGTSTGAVTIGNSANTGAISLNSAAASNFTVAGAGIDLTLASGGGRVVVNGEEAAADALRLLSAAGGLDADVALQMNLDSSQAAGDAIRINASNAAGGIDIDSGTGGITIDSTDLISIDAAAASNFTTSAGAITLTGAGGLTMSATNSAVSLASGSGQMDISADADPTTVNVGTGAAAKTVTLGSSNTTSTTTIESGSGGIAIDADGGSVTIRSSTTTGKVSVPASNDTVASPIATASNNTRVIQAQFTGFGTAAAASQDFTINSTDITAQSALIVTVSRGNIGMNDAKMTIDGIVQSAGSIVVSLTNNGSALLNDDVFITVWVLDSP